MFAEQRQRVPPRRFGRGLRRGRADARAGLLRGSRGRGHRGGSSAACAEDVVG